MTEHHLARKSFLSRLITFSLGRICCFFSLVELWGWGRDVRKISTRVLSISTAPMFLTNMARMPVYTRRLKNPGVSSLNLRFTGQTIKLDRFSLRISRSKIVGAECRTTKPLHHSCHTVALFVVVVVTASFRQRYETAHVVDRVPRYVEMS